MATIAEIIAEINGGIFENTDELITGQVLHDILIDIAEYLQDNVPLTYENGIEEFSGVVKLGGDLTDDTFINAAGFIFQITAAGNISLVSVEDDLLFGSVTIDPDVVALDVFDLDNLTSAQVSLDSQQIIARITNDGYLTGLVINDDGINLQTKGETVTLDAINLTIPRKQSFQDKDGNIMVDEDGSGVLIVTKIVVPDPDGILWELNPNNDGEPDFKLYVP